MSNDEFVFAPVHVTVVHEDGADLVEEAITYACDFCLDTRVAWDYPCARFFITDLGFGSDEEWCACEKCAELIENQQLPMLTLRSLRSQIARGQSVQIGDLDKFGRIQQGFFDHRIGSRMPHVP